MQTTTTKPPPVIKADIRRVLDRMRIQYREVKGGFECVHLPSIDLSSIVAAAAAGGNSHVNGHIGEGSGGQELVITPSTSIGKRGIVRKTSRLSFMRKGGKDAGESGGIESGVQPLNVDKDLPHRPTSLAAAEVSRSSSFLNVPAPIEETSAEQTAEDETVDAETPADGLPTSSSQASADPSSSAHTLTGGASVESRAKDESGVRRPSDGGGMTGDETIKQRDVGGMIAKDFAGTPNPAKTPKPAPATIAPAGTEYDLFDPNTRANDLCVRFDINVVKVKLFVCRRGFLTNPLLFVISAAIRSAARHSVPSRWW